MKSTWLALGGALMIATTQAFAQPAPSGHSAVHPGAHPTVLLRTTDGDIRIELDAQKAPKTVANFLQYVKDGQYSNTIFHRVIPGFMIQGGGYTAAYAEKPTRPAIPIESRNGLKNDLGTIAMARTSDPDSATAQFFINTANNAALDYPGQDGNGYTVFGKVTAGLEVVKKIEATPTTSQRGMENVPATPILIQSATIVAN
jgi:peptidyl-prolyl cis-trans isomerase A (cyclophilin A)